MDPQPELSGQEVFPRTPGLEALYVMAQTEEVTRNRILEKLDSIELSLNEHKQASGERMSRIEANLKAILGNGQPGRLGIAEKKISELSEWKDKSRGWYAGFCAASALLGGVIHWVIDAVRHK